MKRQWIMVDVEADGPCPGLYSMVSFGAVVVEPSLDRTFFGQCCPLKGADFIPAALASCNLTHEETLKYPMAEDTIYKFDDWLSHLDCKPMFISDNNGFDWQFINYYFALTKRSNPFGHSSTNLGSLFKGLNRHVGANFKRLRKTKHTHNPVDDAIGNAEAMLQFGNKIKGLL